MAHIADLMVEKTNSTGLNNHIARELSPHSPHDAATETPQTDEKEKYVWRMHQPAEPRKYQLFPAKDKLSIAAGQKNGEGETTQSTGQNGTNEKDRSTLGSALRLKPKEQTLIRRRKVSVPELGPMTTVQEIAMDSPTIPGRPPLHERSISAPGNSWRQHVFGESMLSCISGPALDENAEMAILDNGNSPAQANPTTTPPSNPQTANNSRSGSPKQQPLSPKSLAPLVIPQTSQSQPQRLLQKNSATRLRSGSTPPEVPPKSARMTEGSPHPRASPFTPLSSTSNLLSSTSSTAPRSGTPTPTPTPLSTLPVSAPEGRSSPKPWSATTTTHSPSTTTNSHSRNQSDVPNSARTFALGHRRGDSEGASSIMDRGRPKKRSDASPASITIPQTLSKSRRSPSTEEQKAFEHLPTGIRATDAPSLLSPAEIEALRKQAVGQASRFQVLASKDVEALSRELRALDERCEYLRKTHRSLRSGRRNLHDRICTYLRSPRVARFSHESMLKQEEALSELDSSIDDWVSKLEQAENRRTRVRQKLLEHVAAALTMQPVAGAERRENEHEHEHERMHMHIVTQMVKGEMNTPPRSPTKASSPERLERVVEEVRVASPETMVRSSRNGRDVESIRIYADSDVYALLADVEEEINRMGEQGEADRALAEAEKEQKKEDTIQAGITLNAVAFEGMLAHSRSYQNIRTPTPEFV